MGISLQTLQKLNAEGILNGLDKVKFGDAMPTINGVNLNMPSAVLGQLSTQVIDKIMALRAGGEALGGQEKLLDWADEKYFVPFVEKAGTTTPYADNNTPLAASLNANFSETGHYRFSSSFVYGSLQAEQFSKARINYADVLLRSATEAIAIEMNRTAFNGYLDKSANAMLVYGLLNNPSLPNYQVETKKIEAMTWEEVMAFFAKAIVALVKSSGNHINGKSNIRCVLPASVFAHLQSKYTQLGISVYKQLTDLYTGMTFVPAIELENAENNTNAIYFIGEANVGGIDKTTKLGYSELALMGNVVQEHNGYSQVVSAGTCGALVYKPAFVVRFSGV